MGTLTNLQSFNLQSNLLQEIPVTFRHFQNLEYLNLSYNQLSRVPSEIGQLINLETLDLENNELSDLPIGLGNLQHLNYLDLSHNQLQSLPEDLISMLQNIDEELVECFEGLYLSHNLFSLSYLASLNQRLPGLIMDSSEELEE